MPSTLVLNADPVVCPALGTWMTNNTQLLSGFSLLIGEDVIEELKRRHDLGGLAITPCRAIREGVILQLQQEFWKEKSVAWCIFQRQRISRAVMSWSSPLFVQPYSAIAPLP